MFNGYSVCYKYFLLLVYKYRYCINIIALNYNTRNKLNYNLNFIKFYKTVTF